jgi:hypothetical protein
MLFKDPVRMCEEATCAHLAKMRSFTDIIKACLLIKTSMKECWWLE